MALFRRRNRKQEVDWQQLAIMLAFGWELEAAETEGIADEAAQTDRAIEVRDRVFEEIGGAHVVGEALQLAHAASNGDADRDLELALAGSGYFDARQWLFPSK